METYYQPLNDDSPIYRASNNVIRIEPVVLVLIDNQQGEHSTNVQWYQ